MSPIIIITEEKETITLKTEDFKKYISDAYYSGYNEGYDKGKNEKPVPNITYRGFSDPIPSFSDPIPVTCDDTTRVTLLNKVDNNELLRGKG